MNPDEQNKAKNKLEQHFFYSSAEIHDHGNFEEYFENIGCTWHK